MRFNKTIYVLASLALIIMFSFNVFAIANNNFEILLKAKHFTPEKGISELAENQIQSRGLNKNTPSCPI